MLYAGQSCVFGVGKYCYVASAWRHVRLYRVPTLLLTKNPGLFQDPMKNFSGPFRSPRMFKYKEKMAFTYNIQSVVHCRKFSMKQKVI